MIFKNIELTPELIRQNQEITRRANQLFADYPPERIRKRPADSAWNAVDCIEHLNRTYDWYLPQIEKSLRQSRPSSHNNLTYQSGYIGDKMTEGSRPSKGKIRFRMKTFKKFEPHTDDKEVETILNTFRKNQAQFESFIRQAEPYDLGKIRVVSAIGPILRFKLGDCFRFIIAHGERHLLQCAKLLEKSE